MHGEELAKVLFYYGFEVSSHEFKIICPFHEDVNPSLKVNLQNGTWFCFGCNMSGDALKFVILAEKRNGLNDLQATIKFRKILNSDKVEKITLNTFSKKVDEISVEENLLVAKDYYYNLKKQDWSKKPEDEEARNAILYMKNRGFNFKALTNIGCKYTFNKSYPLVFPMMDNGEFKGWVCRTTNKQIEQKRKYLYNKGFSRRNTLCGNYNNKTPLYIVEGFMDMLKLRMFGIKNVVAILGWKITAEQIQKLKKAGIKNIIAALDNDECGKKGNKYLGKYFKVINFCYKNNVKDIGEMNESSFKVMNERTLNKLKKGVL